MIDVDVMKYKDMIFKIIQNYNSRWLDEDDMFQEGCIGVMYAYNSYNAKSDMSFDTWVYNCIRWQISKAIYGDRKAKDINIISTNTPINNETETELIDLIEDSNNNDFYDIENKLMYEFYIDEFYRVLEGDCLKVMIYMFENDEYNWSKALKYNGINTNMRTDIKIKIQRNLRKSAYIRNRLD
ncbi:sigma factor [Peptostreptococcus equinus]|uniref:Sigma factor n=1 Tax=Peptostreptococcus equinus TaxID=3003601 RepID=A0ABY7JM27_9FIRM|nr:sigma factor [Peptostreptococcus sp. CBA3647]WAW14411.1 sigma factor [Peptostreptococcus sp. CBA3647]